jgi:hypothetical protein
MLTLDLRATIDTSVINTHHDYPRVAVLAGIIEATGAEFPERRDGEDMT